MTQRPAVRLAFAGGPLIEVSSDDRGVLTWLGELFGPALGEDPGTAPTWRIELTGSAAAVAAAVADRPAAPRLVPVFAPSHQLVELPGWTSDGVLVLDDAERHAVIAVDGPSITVLGDPAPKRWRFTVALVIYELVGAGFRRDWVELHAAGVVHRGRTHLVMGPKGAGKSTLSVALARAGAGLLANDRCFVRPGEAVGLPTPVKLLPRTVELLPELAGPRPPRPYLWTRAELSDATPAAASDEALILSPAEVVDRLGAPAPTGAWPLGSILVPQVAADDSGLERSPVPTAEAEELLLANVYRAADPRAATAFEDLAGGRPPDRYDLVAGLALRHPVLRVRLGARVLGDRDALLSMLEGPG